MFSEQLLLPLVVIGLVILTLVMSGVARRYQQQQAARRSVVRRMEAAIRQVELALERLQPVGLDSAVKQVFRGDVVDRYRMIGRVFRRYPGLAQCLEQAEVRLRNDAVNVAGVAPTIKDEVELQRLLGSLEDLLGYLDGQGTVHPLSRETLEAVQTALGERRAELLFQHHEALFRAKQEEGDVDAARTHMRRLMEALRTLGPNTSRVHELYQRAAIELDTPLAAAGGSSRSTGG